MPLPELIDPEWSPEQLCDFADRWGIAHELAFRLFRMARRLEFPVRMISGERTDAMQDELRRDGRPTAPNDLSTHLACPATGADVLPTIAAVRTVKARLGTEGTLAGMRWGGGGSVDEGGIPSDWPHFDLGPRRPDPQVAF